MSEPTPSPASASSGGGVTSPSSSSAAVRAARIMTLYESGVSGLRQYIRDAALGDAAAREAAELTGGLPRNLSIVVKSLSPMGYFDFWSNVFLFASYIGEARWWNVRWFAALAACSCCCRCCGCGAGGSGSRAMFLCLPRYVRLSNAYVRWDDARGALRGSTGLGGGDFAFLKEAVRAGAVVWVVAFALLVGVPLLVPIAGFSTIDRYAEGVNVPPILFLWRSLLYTVFVVAWLLIVGVALYMASNKTRLVGSRVGDLPSLLRQLLGAPTAPQTMVSYCWGDARYVNLARSLAEVLPDSWIDVRSLVSGQHLPTEIMRASSHVRVLVILLSPKYVASTNCASELFATVRNRRMAGAGACHTTIVLIEEEESGAGVAGLGGGAGALTVVHSQLAISSAAAAGSAAASGNPAAPNWAAIREVLQQAGCIVVPSIERLLHVLDEAGVRSTTPRQIAKTFAWFKTYSNRGGIGNGGGGPGEGVQEARIPWNFTQTVSPSAGAQSSGNGGGGCAWAFRCCGSRGGGGAGPSEASATNGAALTGGPSAAIGKAPSATTLDARSARRLASSGGFLCWLFSACFHCCCRRGAVITTGARGACLSYDGLSPPMPHAAPLPQALFVCIIALGISCDALTYLSASYALGPLDTLKLFLDTLYEVIRDFGWGITAAGWFLIFLFIPFALYGNEIVAPRYTLHSRILFPFFALFALQEMQEEVLELDHASAATPVGSAGGGGGGAGNTDGAVATVGASASASASHPPTLVVGRGGSDIELATSPGFRALGAEGTPTSSDAERTPLYAKRGSVGGGSVAAPSAALRLQSLHIVFAASASPIRGTFQHIHEFFARYVFGIDLAEAQGGSVVHVHMQPPSMTSPTPSPTPPPALDYPRSLVSAEEILQSPQHPAPMTIYVFALDTLPVRDAFRRAMASTRGWASAQVVLVIDKGALERPDGPPAPITAASVAATKSGPDAPSVSPRAAVVSAQLAAGSAASALARAPSFFTTNAPAGPGPAAAATAAAAAAAVNEAAAAADIPIGSFMCIAYETHPDAKDKPLLAKQSPYPGIVPAIVEAIASKVAPAFLS